ncbi:uncharacterized protein LOC131668762 [Phymastichus coffea]|uniref:uncharacterized protein LOC131668762 n=1 Tax=Phymastichus coffea TaxID=108790 RepID=UPI00273B3542|nr:uncharacterized protein LOC131668762 [Phymastichus coffea]XP_058799165.1 uncharacterized protein LOC131668762 [Phymastichus coffea]
MDKEPLWSQDPYGNYWLLFPNRHALGNDQIKDIFSQYGTVNLITKSGDEKGLRFVRYSCLNDVKNAVDNLKDHPQIKLIPYRPKNKNSNNVKKEENNEMYSEKRNFFQRKPRSDCNHKNSIEQRLNGGSNVTDFQNIEYELCNEKVSSSGSNASVKLLSDSFSTRNSYIDKPQLVHASNSINFPKPLVQSDQKLKTLLQIRGTNSDTFNTGTITNRSNIGYNDEDELPDLVANKIKPIVLSKKVIYNADEVIVANIPNGFGSAYILHLFQDFEPLAISYVKTVLKNEIRYCHVYFKSAEDSMAVETMFDKYDLCGKRLNVMRLCNLEEEVVN